MDDLATFLKAAAMRPFSWADADCLSWLGDWVAVRHGINPHARYRHRYATQAGAYRLIAEHGSPCALVDAAVSPLGIRRTEEPRRGDIAIVQGPNDPRPVGAIVLGERSASLGVTGVYVRTVPILAAWRV